METAEDLRKDSIAKALLSNPKCLAYIVRDALKEAKGMGLDEIAGRLGAAGGNCSVWMLHEGLIAGHGSIAYDLVFEFDLPDGERAVVDIEIRGRCPSWIARRQMMYLSGLAWYASRDPAKDYSAVRPVCCIWIFLNPRAADRNRIYRMKLRREGSEIPMALVEMNIGDPGSAPCDALRLLGILFQKSGDPESNLDLAAAESNIDWGDDTRGIIVSTLEEFIAEYRIGLLESAREDGFIEGREEGLAEGMEKGRENGKNEMRAEMVLNYAGTVRKAVSSGLTLEGAMALVPEDMTAEVAEAFRKNSQQTVPMSCLENRSEQSDSDTGTTADNPSDARDAQAVSN